LGFGEVKDRLSLFDALKRSDAKILNLIDFLFSGEACVLSSAPWVIEQVYEFIEIESRYEGYIRRELELVEKMQKHESKAIPKEFSFEKISGLSKEVLERLNRVRPERFGQLRHIPGVTPAAAALVFVHLDRHDSSQHA
jgi:tRNA U34 5-carboxymethylaminomethyl modifying enzyme MnmG/GidA